MDEKTRDGYRPSDKEIQQMLREEELERERYFWDHYGEVELTDDG